MSLSEALHKPPSFESYLKNCQTEFNVELEKRLAGYDSGVAEAMRYSLLSTSKRMRPIFCLETCQALSGNRALAYSAASALEMVHTYSLIHDDLPSMDDDDLRRGRPTNHKVFGEARAILAGDALLTLAFQILSEDAELSDAVKIHLVRHLSKASGLEGMVLGQDLDIQMKATCLEDLENLHRHKTGALLAAAPVMGAICAGASPAVVQKLQHFGMDMGLAFQIRDDILDVEGGEEMGKPARSDQKNEKPTYVSFLGLEAAKKEQAMWTEKALDGLNSIEFKYSNQLEQLTRYVVERHV